MIVRLANRTDVAAICAFGATHISDHYAPLIGDEAAQRQVDDWWTEDRMGPAADEDRLVIAEHDGDVIGVTEWSVYEGTPVIWKLYVHPSRRGEGIGSKMLRAIVNHLPVGTQRLQVEHFAANQQASSFYEREGFTILRTLPHPTNPAMSVVWREQSLA